VFCDDGAAAFNELMVNLARCKNSESETFQLVIMDYHMPSLNGIDVITRCRKVYDEDGFFFPRAVLLTAITDPRLKRSCVNNVDHFMEKPPTYEGLKEVFDSL